MLKKWSKPLYNTVFWDKVVFRVRQVITGICCMESFYAGRHIWPMGYQNPRNNRSCYNEVLLHMLALNLDSGPCQVFLQLLALDLSFQKDKNYLSKCKALTMKYTAHAVGKPSVYFHRPQLVCMAEMIHSSTQQNKSVYRVSQTEHILNLSHALHSAHDLISSALKSSRVSWFSAREGGSFRHYSLFLSLPRQYTVTFLGNHNVF